MAQATQGIAGDSGAADIGGKEYLAFTLGQEEYGIDILKVQEIRGYEAVTRIANAPEFIKGVVNLRGIIVPVVDMRIKFKLGEPTYDQFTVVIILNIDSRVMGMVVDSVSDVTTLTARPDQAGARHGQRARYQFPHRPRYARRTHADPDRHRETDDQPGNGSQRSAQQLTAGVTPTAPPATQAGTP
jgi:purine-binding chemotaxis protein CheW